MLQFTELTSVGNINSRGGWDFPGQAEVVFDEEKSKNTVEYRREKTPGIP